MREYPADDRHFKQIRGIMGSRRSIFHNAHKEEVFGEMPPTAPINVLMDESGNGNPSHPLIVGAVVSDIDSEEIESRVRDLYNRLAARRAFTGYEGFEKFKRVGFHASSDPWEFQDIFYDHIQQEVGFKAHIITTDRTTLTELAEVEQLELMYNFLLCDIVTQFRRCGKISCRIEQNEELRPRLPKLATDVSWRAATRTNGASIPKLVIEMIPKNSIVSMAIIDYIMLAISRWLRAGRPASLRKDPTRAFRQVEPVISVLYSLEDGILSNRKSRFPSP